MPVRSIVTFVDPAEVGQSPAALSLALDWAAGQGARVVVLSFPVDVTGDALSEEAQDFARTSAAIRALADKTGVPVFIAAESWRNILWDSNDRRRDLANARYMFRVTVVDYDVALAIFPDKKEQLDRCVQEGDELSVFKSWINGTGLISGLDAFGANSDEIDFITPKPVGLFNPRRRIRSEEHTSELQSQR